MHRTRGGISSQKAKSQPISVPYTQLTVKKKTVNYIVIGMIESGLAYIVQQTYQ